MPTRSSGTVLITSWLDGLVHEVPDGNATARRTGECLALCGGRVVPTPLVTPVGRPCGRCVAVLAVAQPPTDASRRRRRRGWLWRVLHPHSDAAIAERWRRS
jgi:hypothetical protein